MKKLIFAFLCAFTLTSPVLAKGGVVSSADPRATEAGQEMLRAGGSATDAALAMMLALTVVEPQSSGIGGGGFLIHHDGKTGRIATLDGRETAPSTASPIWFLDKEGKPMGFREAVPGGRSVGVPGNLALAGMAHKRWGKLPWAKLFEPAIRLADKGYAVTPRLESSLKMLAPVWSDFPDAKAIYWQSGKPKATGDTVRNPALAAFLRTLASTGSRTFYVGANAKAISKATRLSVRNSAEIPTADINRYQAKLRPAVCTTYRVYKLCGMGPPSSGATTVFQILGLVERFDLPALGKDSPESWHVIAEAMRLAYADREKYLADSDFVPVPVAGLIDKAYVAKRSATISAETALKKYDAGNPPGAGKRTAALSGEVDGTTHFVAVDGDGNIATMTSTVEGPFGSQLVVNGYFLNNELTDFTFAPEKDGAPVANRVQPGKRPLSSMSPTIVYGPDGKPVFALGAAGGKTIIMQVAKALIAKLDWGLDAKDAIAAPGMYFAGDAIQLEANTPLSAMAGALAQKGHTVIATDMPRLKANAVELTIDGWRGAADPRSEGTAGAE